MSKELALGSYIGLRTAIGAAEVLALTFRDSMDMKQSEALKYNAIIAYLGNVRKQMDRTTYATNAQKLILNQYGMDASGAYSELACEIGLIPAGKIDDFMTEFNNLLNKYK